MSTFIKCDGENIVLKNDFAEISVFANDATVLSMKRLDTGESVLGGETAFFALFDSTNERVNIEKLSLDGDVITIHTVHADVRVKVECLDRYFTFEILDNLALPLEKIELARLDCDYETDGDSAYGVVGMTMTVNMNPTYNPDASLKKTKASAERVCGNTMGAKYALVAAPLELHRDILKEATLTIAPEKGITLTTSGAFAKDNLFARQNYTILLNSKPELVQDADKYLSMGVETLDFHQGPWAFYNGNFKCTELRDLHEFKEKITDRLAENGISASLHTYVQYIAPQCHDLLSDVDFQKDLMVLESFTLAEDISDDDAEVKTVESIENVSTDHTFFSKSLPYLMIGEEIIQFSKGEKSFVKCLRGQCGTKAVAHRKGETVKHMEGYFNLFAPTPGSPLFLKVAENTAKAYNDGGFKMYYFDAIDGMWQHTDKAWYYDALFVHTVLKHSIIPPILEFSDEPASLWCARSRGGAWDVPSRGYREFNKYHVERNRDELDSSHLVGMMGWYQLYSNADNSPGNNKYVYQYRDEAEHIGALTLINGYSMVHRGKLPSPRYPAYVRNAEIYLKYYDLIKRGYFSGEYLSQLKDLDREFHLKNKGGDNWIFEEKKFVTKRYFDIEDENRNKDTFTNPFKAQKPFVRLFADMTTAGVDPMLLMPFDEDKQLFEKTEHSYGAPIDLTNHSAIKVRIHGNGKKGGAVRITLTSRQIDSGYSNTYIVETDFEGWRDYVFFDTHKAERPDLPFDSKFKHFYRVYLNGAMWNEITHIMVDTAGDIEGVRMGNIYGCRPMYDVIKNPTVKVGESELMFECELKSTDYIEWDGENANVYDRYGNETKIWCEGTLEVPQGEFSAELKSACSLNGGVQNMKLTFGFTGEEIDTE